MTTILSAIPFWVYPLLLGLIVLGARANRDRSSSVLLIYALPLLGLLSLNRALGLGDLATTALAMSWVIGGAIGYALQPRWTIARNARRVQLRGEKLTMVTVLILFSANFGAGMTLGMAPDMAQSALFGEIYGLISGGLAGTLAGRALSVGLTPIT